MPAIGNKIANIHTCLTFPRSVCPVAFESNHVIRGCRCSGELIKTDGRISFWNTVVIEFRQLWYAKLAGTSNQGATGIAVDTRRSDSGIGIQIDGIGLAPKGGHVRVTINPWERRELIESCVRIVRIRNHPSTNSDGIYGRALTITKEDTGSRLAISSLTARTKDNYSVSINRRLIITVKKLICTRNEVAIVDDDVEQKIKVVHDN